MAKLGRPKKKHIAELSSPCPGVAIYETAAGAIVFHAHWSADPQKDEAWADAVASKFPGGRLGVDWLQEMEADDEAKIGAKVYWAFSRERNVIKGPLVPDCSGTNGIPPEWPIYIGADFGQRNKTAIIFLAQDPDTRKIYVWNSIVADKGIDVSLKEAVYRVLCEHLSIELDEMALAGAYQFIERAVPDPSADAYTSFFAMEPYPLLFTKKPTGKPVNKHRGGEYRVNCALWPAVTHCGVMSYVDRTDEEPATERLCGRCGQGPFPATPGCYIIEGAAPELVDQLDDLVDREPTAEGLEIPEKYLEIPRDAADGFRYVMFDLWDPDRAEYAEEDTARKIRILREKPVKSATDKLQLMMATAMEQQKLAQDRKLGRRGSGPSLARAGALRHGSIRFRAPEGTRLR